MKIAHKLILGMLVPAIVVGLAGMYILAVGQDSMRSIIDDTSAAYVRAIMSEIDRVMHSRIIGWQAYTSGQDIQQVLDTENRLMEQRDDREDYIDRQDAEWRGTGMRHCLMMWQFWGYRSKVDVPSAQLCFSSVRLLGLLTRRQICASMVSS